MTLSTTTEERLRSAFGLLVDATPPGAEFEDLSEVTLRNRPDHPSRPNRLPVSGIAAVFGLMSLLFVGLWTLGSEPTAPVVSVDHTEVAYEISVPADCDPAHQEYTSAEVDIWGPDPDGVFRIELGYPDGSSEWFILDSLVNTESRRIWSPVTGQGYIGDGLPDPFCPPDSGASPNRFLDTVLYQFSLTVSTDYVVSIDGTTFTDVYADLEPAREEVIAGVETKVFTTTSSAGLRSSVWFDEQSSRVQRLTKEFSDDGGDFTEVITVTNRTTAQVSPDLFDTEGVLLYSYSPGQDSR